MKRHISFPFQPTFLVIAVITFALSGLAIGQIGRYFFDWSHDGEPSVSSVLFFWMCMMLLCAVCMSFFTAFFILLPISRLVWGTKEIVKGNFNIRIRENEKIRELKILVKNFNIMAAALESTEIVHNDFARNVSHEFKTPLSVIKGYGNFLQQDQVEPEERIVYAQKIVEYSDRLTALTDKILLLSKLDHQQTGLKCHTFNLAEQIRQVVLLFEKSWSEKEILVFPDLPEILLYTGNEELLFQVWQNLVGNALKFTPVRGSISIFCSPESVPGSVRNPHISICVQDTGTGIASESLSCIFETFYQSDTSRTGMGCGLGLSLVKRIVELHGGTVSAESRLGEGSTFTVCLPVTEE